MNNHHFQSGLWKISQHSYSQQSVSIHPVLHLGLIHFILNGPKLSAINADSQRVLSKDVICSNRLSVLTIMNNNRYVLSRHIKKRVRIPC